ncbi:MAG: sugar phosphate isomerase/epimerase [Acidobacteriota bacterium]|nr:sugar phosphate isomerase/epimerase [Acidobacteriota bacterium]
MNRRKFVALTLAGASALRAKDRIGRSRISAISDEVATTPDEAIAFAKQYGLEWLELRTVPGPKKPYFFLEPEELKVAAKQFKDNGIRISFLNTNLLKFTLPGTEAVGRKQETPEARAVRLPREQAQFDRRMENLRKCIRAAQAFGTPNIRVFTFSRVAEPDKLTPRIVEVLEPMAKVAASEGVRLLIENETSQNVATCAETAAILKLLPPKTVGTNWDALNGADVGETAFPDGYGFLPKDRIWNVQWKGKSILDTPKHLDWAAIIHALENDGYTGALGLETHYFDGTNIEKAHASMKEMMRIVGAA